jgi:cyclopropane fatty-acyl-phospholipid synthase-like methyltransferase
MSIRGLKRRLLRRLGVMPPKYKSFVGPPENFELIGKTQFEHLRHWGLDANHYLLDIGCGCLRGGQFAIKILEPGHYYGIDPNQWLIDEGIRHELGASLLQLKRPVFSNEAEFNLGVFGREFDFLMAQSIFSHTSQAQMRKIISEAAKVMHQKSIFLATYILGKTDYTGTEWSYPDGIRFTFERVRAFAAEANLECATVDWFHTRQQWLVFYNSANSDFVGRRLRAAKDTGSRASSAKIRDSY